jgi:hypothetical protein
MLEAAHKIVQLLANVGRYCTIVLHRHSMLRPTKSALSSAELSSIMAARACTALSLNPAKTTTFSQYYDGV